MIARYVERYTVNYTRLDNVKVLLYNAIYPAV